MPPAMGHVSREKGDFGVCHQFVTSQRRGKWQVAGDRIGAARAVPGENFVSLVTCHMSPLFCRQGAKGAKASHGRWELAVGSWEGYPPPVLSRHLSPGTCHNSEGVNHGPVLRSKTAEGGCTRMNTDFISRKKAQEAQKTQDQTANQAENANVQHSIPQCGTERRMPNQIKKKTKMRRDLPVTGRRRAGVATCAQLRISSWIKSIRPERTR